MGSKPTNPVSAECYPNVISVFRDENGNGDIDLNDTIQLINFNGGSGPKVTIDRAEEVPAIRYNLQDLGISRPKMLLHMDFAELKERLEGTPNCPGLEKHNDDMQWDIQFRHAVGGYFYLNDTPPVSLVPLLSLLNFFEIPYSRKSITSKELKANDYLSTTRPVNVSEVRESHKNAIKRLRAEASSGHIEDMESAFDDVLESGMRLGMKKSEIETRFRSALSKGYKPAFESSVRKFREARDVGYVEGERRFREQAFEFGEKMGLSREQIDNRL